MTIPDALSRLLSSYGQYYNVNTETPAPPFTAEAVFHSHDEQYFLLKSAKISEADSHEYVFIATAEHLDLAGVETFDEAAWREGLSRTKPHNYHHCTDTTLVLLAQEISPEAQKRIRRLRHYKSYRCGLQGFSQFRVIALELSSSCLICNRPGQNLKKLFRNIFFKKGR